MRELGRVGTDAFKDEDVLEGVGEMVLAANNLGDAQIGIVDAGREVIGRVFRPTPLTQEGEVFDLVGWLGHGTVDGVVELDDAVLAAGDTIANSERLSGGGAAIGFFTGEFAHAGVEEPSSLRGGAPSGIPSPSAACAGVKSR